MEKQEKHYEEAEVIGAQSSGRDKFEDAAINFATESAEELRGKLLWAGFGGLFLTLFGFFFVLFLVISLLFWLLPKILAAILAAIVVVPLLLAGAAVIRLVKIKK